MRTETKTITLYKFEELSKEAQENAISRLYDINIMHEWWDGIYDDATTIGLTITGFDLDRRNGATGHFIKDVHEVVQLIFANHGEMCETYKTAKQFDEDWTNLVFKYSNGVNTKKVMEENEYDFDNEADELEKDFLKSLLEDYATILQKECDYLSSEEAIKETIEANEYEFTQDGKLY